MSEGLLGRIEYEAGRNKNGLFQAYAGDLAELVGELRAETVAIQKRIVEAWAAGKLTEGQAAGLLGLDRLGARELARDKFGVNEPVGVAKTVEVFGTKYGVELCPKCGSANVSGGVTKLGFGETLTVGVHCNDCEFTVTGKVLVFASATVGVVNAEMDATVNLWNRLNG